MKKFPIILAGLFVFITLTRVAEYTDAQMGAGILGWVYSIGLGVAVFVSAYYTRKTKAEEKTPDRNRRVSAWICLVFFMGADGFFNLLEVLRSMAGGANIIAGWVYGLFPTLASAALGVLQGFVDRTENTPGKRSLFAQVRALLAIRLDTLALPAQSANEIIETANTESQSEPIAIELTHKCELCEMEYKSKGAHMRQRHPDLVQHKRESAGMETK
jgi:hypothetical protein